MQTTTVIIVAIIMVDMIKTVSFWCYVWKDFWSIWIHIRVNLWLLMERLSEISNGVYRLNAHTKRVEQQSQKFPNFSTII